MNKRTALITFGFTILLILCGIATLYTGEVPWEKVYAEAFERIFTDKHPWNPLIDERIPRLIITLCTGASLAVSGAVMQSLFQNPLASPSVLGITSGGSLLVMLVFITGLHYKYPYIIPIAAVAGCLLTLAIVYLLAESDGMFHLNQLILTGIAISTLLIAIQGILMYALRDRWQLLQTLTEWEAGSTIDRTWHHVHMQLPLTIAGLIGCWKYRYELDILTLGFDEASALGVDAQQVRKHLFLCVALLTGGALAAVGIIAFFGLILPHILRSLIGPGNRHLIPLCTLVGAVIFCMMDLTLRIFGITTLSIGNLSAIIGGIFFVVLLFRTNRNPLYGTS